MSPANEPCLRLINRAYCYLRLAGMEPAAACDQLRGLVGVLTEVPLPGAGGTGAQDRLWREVMAGAAPQLTPLRDAGPAAPPIVRGQLRYSR